MKRFKIWLRNTIGVPELTKSIQILDNDLQDIKFDLAKCISDLSTLFNETDTRRKKASDRFVQETIMRLATEDWARKHTIGESK